MIPRGNPEGASDLKGKSGAMKKLLGLERGATKSIAIGAEIAACVTVMKDGRNLYVKKDGTYFVLLQGEAVAL